MVVVALALAALPLHAEVMDKEMSVAQIWQSVLLCGGIAMTVGFIWRWLLIPSFLFSLLYGPLFAVVEWLDPYVGPAIAQEAGGSYGRHAYAALGAVCLLHWAFWKATAAFRWSQGVKPVGSE